MSRRTEMWKERSLHEHWRIFQMHLQYWLLWRRIHLHRYTTVRANFPRTSQDWKQLQARVKDITDFLITIRKTAWSMMMFTGLRLPIVPGKEKKKRPCNKVLTITGALDGEFFFFSFCKKNPLHWTPTNLLKSEALAALTVMIVNHVNRKLLNKTSYEKGLVCFLEELRKTL